MSGSTLRPKESPSQTAGPYVHIGLTPGQLRVMHSEIDDLDLARLRSAWESESWCVGVRSTVPPSLLVMRS